MPAFSRDQIARLVEAELLHRLSDDAPSATVELFQIRATVQRGKRPDGRADITSTICREGRANPIARVAGMSSIEACCAATARAVADAVDGTTPLKFAA